MALRRLACALVAAPRTRSLSYVSEPDAAAWARGAFVRTGLYAAAGFVKAKDLIALEGGSAEGPVEAPPRTTRAVNLLLERYGISMRTLDMSDFPAEVERIKQLYPRRADSVTT